MNRLVALLRGINVGTTGRISMADLIACTEAVGCTDVRTVLATGNVIVTDHRPAAQLREVLETTYAERFGYDAVVQVLAREAVVTAVDSYPFDSLEAHHDYVVFSDEPEVTGRVVHEMSGIIDDVAHPDSGPATGTEAVSAGPGCVYWRVPTGATLASPAAKVLDRRENKRHLTSRNIRTLRKVLAAG